MGACSIQPRTKKSSSSSSSSSLSPLGRFHRFRSRSSLSSVAASSSGHVGASDSLDSVDGPPDCFLSGLPSEIRAKLLLAAETHNLDLSGLRLYLLPCGLDAVPGLTSLNLSNNSLDERALPMLVSTSLASLLLSQNEIESLTAALFTSLPALHTLLLSRNALTTLPAELPADALPRLALLDVSCNNIARLPDNVHALGALRTLSLASNRLAELPPSFGLLHLASVDLSDNRLSALPPTFAQQLGASLRTLSLAGNDLADVPEPLFGLTALTALDLSHNAIDRLPDDRLAELVALRTLNLRSNRLAELSPAAGLGRLAQLTELDASSNRLRAFDLGAAELLADSLLTLRLQHNRIGQLAPHFFQLTALATLDLSHNRLATDALLSVGQLSYLSSLDLSGNAAVDALPADVADISFLASGRFARLSLSCVPPALCSVGFLKTLDLSASRIQTVPPEIGELAQLEQLDVSHNQLDCLPDTVGSLKQLVRLNAAFNRIRSLPAALGSGCAALETLQLAHNCLTELPASLGGLSALRQLHLSGNALSSAVADKQADDKKKPPVEHRAQAHRSNSDSDQHAQLVSKHDAVAAAAAGAADEDPAGAVKSLKIAAHRSNSDVDTVPPASLLSSSSSSSSLLLLSSSSSSSDFWQCLAPLRHTLQQLHLADNGLQSPPAVLQQLVELRHVDLSANGLTSLPAGLLAPLGKLSTLCLADNRLAELPAGDLAQLSSLTLLVVDNNKLSALPELRLQALGSALGNPLERAADVDSPTWIVSPPPPPRSSSSDTGGDAVGVSGTVGARQRMEDSVFVQCTAGRGFLVGLFDGHGGQLASHVCARNVQRVFAASLLGEGAGAAAGGEDSVVSTAPCAGGGRFPYDGSSARLFEQDPVARAMQHTFEQLDALLCGDGVGGGTTALLAYRAEQLLYVANAGDSRAVLCRGGAAVPLSVDHQPLLERERRRLQELAGGYVLQGRVRGVLAVTRALGDAQLRPWVVATPDVSRLQLTADDRYLLLACDGFWDVFSDADAVALATSLFDGGMAPAHVALQLRDAALARGSTDNVTVCTIDLQQ